MSQDHDDFAVEPVPGLPETPPKDERILWQGSPSTWRLAWEACALPWVAGYFAVLFAWRFVTLVDIAGASRAFQVSTPFLILGGICCALLLLFAWIQARATVYTVTTKRVAMRVGAALTVTLNLPYSRIERLDMVLRRGGTGSLALTLTDPCPLSYAMAWPHVRPWAFNPVRPSLRCIPEAETVGRLVAQAAQSYLAVPEVRRTAPLDGVPAE